MTAGLLRLVMTSLIDIHSISFRLRHTRTALTD